MAKKQTIYLSIAATGFILAVAFVGVRYLLYQGYIRMNYPSYEEYPIQGIDISHHQKQIDWDKLDKQAVQFAFIKATEGADFKDTLFHVNFEHAKRLNIAVAAYHFFSFCKSGKEQANNFIESVPYDSLNLPPIIDLEFGGNCKQENHSENLVSEIAEYIEIIEQHYKKKVILYSTNEFYKEYLTNRFLDNPIWIRNILSTPQLAYGRKWLFWQFTNRGHLDGIKTYVDQNVFAGSKAEFEQLRRINNVNSNK